MYNNELKLRDRCTLVANSVDDAMSDTTDGERVQISYSDAVELVRLVIRLRDVIDATEKEFRS